MAIKSSVVWLLALLLISSNRPAAALTINGQNYVPLTDWARANGFYGFTRNHGDEIILTNKNSRLEFDVDSAQAVINGVNVRLSLPVAGHKTVPAISQLDVDSTIRPLIYPQKSSAKRVLTICLDPGHGGKDTGNRAPGFFAHYEKTYTLALALELKQQLQKAGFNVILTRTGDTYPELPARPDFANRNHADLFISLHFNSSPSNPQSVAGPETYCITPVGAASSNSQGEGSSHGATAANRVEQKSLLLAYQVQKSLVIGLSATDRSVRRARYAVLRDATMPAILIEGGYMSHPIEGKKIFDAGYRKQMAAAIVRGVQNYQKLTAPPVPAVTPPLKTNKNAHKNVPGKKSAK
ncbi:MAG TPA: N-acetylmuramoyl-L-alanine amidase [Verrucomicrobiae bacterium]